MSKGFINQPTFWSTNPKATELLTTMWQDGCSAGVISKELTHKYKTKLSRSAIIGKVSRLGLRGDRQLRPTKDFRSKKVKATPAVKTIEAPPALHVTESIRDLPYELPESTTHIYKLKKCQCRWPVGNEGALLFCGGIVDKDAKLKFCPDHLKRAIRQQYKAGPNAAYFVRAANYR